MITLTYDNIKIKKKKQSLILSLSFLQKPEEEWQADTPSITLNPT